MLTWLGEAIETEEYKTFEKELLEAIKPPLDARPPTVQDLRKNWLRTWEYWAVMKNGKLNKEDTVLEFGAYPSFIGVYLAKNIVKKMIVSDTFQWCKNRHDKLVYTKEEWIEELNKYNLDNLEVTEIDIQCTGYPNKTFDKIISHGVLEHVTEDDRALRSMYDILKDDGLISMTIDFKWGEGIPYDRRALARVYNSEMLYKLIDNSPFECVEDLRQIIEAKASISKDESSIFALAILLRKKK